MNSIINAALHKAILVLLKPLVNILLRNGVVFSAFSELVKKSYVDVAFDDFTSNNKKPTISSVAALTGLTRKEVKRLRELEEAHQDQTGQKFNRATRVISGWLNDPDYYITPMNAAELTLEGEKGSFAQLVKKYSGDIPAKAMLDVLLLAGNVVQSERGVSLIKHAYIPQGDEEVKLRILGQDSSELIATINHNLTCKEGRARFQRKVSNRLINPADAIKFEQYSNKRSQLLLEDFNQWLVEHEVPLGEDESQCQQVTVGIYFYKDCKDTHV
ncbi:DUF6502 family protein [Motilimonas pumila]|uniref:Uncharacterized protein n=1 Tax=Motilimonas pumila TaxID=2303987 RepID=A0A418YFG1_9GAMM|nr:DUF6502 family protein [Motilimonas pumila]RJG48123.1 hypothetical protein D1Z90_08600 [Motilimonas pumila]